MKKILSIVFLCATTVAFAQVNPSSSTQSTLTGGAAATSNMTPATLAQVSMLDMNRFHGKYANGNVEAQSDVIGITHSDGINQPLDFQGTVIMASTASLELNGTDAISGQALTLEITPAAQSKATPRELYIINEVGGSNVWILTEDPFNPKK